MKTKLDLLGLWLVCNLAAIIASFWMLCAIISNSKRAWALARSFDRVANVAFGGKETETISSRAGRELENNTQWACRLCKWLDKFEKDHCKNSIGS